MRFIRCVVVLEIAALILFCAAIVPASNGNGSARFQPTLWWDSQAPLQAQTPTIITLPLPCQALTAQMRCFGPQQLHAAYGFAPLFAKGIDGRGRTIVILDAYQSPTLARDVAQFDVLFQLPTVRMRILAPNGLAQFDARDLDQIGWAGEITLDVEWAHAAAPGAAITLVLAKSDRDADLLAALQYVVTRHLGDVLSISFGEAERCASDPTLQAQHALLAEATAQGMTVIAASGDAGSALPTCDGASYQKAVATPASDPLALAVGGTHLDADPATGRYVGETAWNDDFGATGGGFSANYLQPAYQHGVVATMRGVPDVALDADPNSGVVVLWSTPPDARTRLWIVGGTSAAAPQWAGIVALADQLAGHRLGAIQPRLAQLVGHIPVFHDITLGNNTYAWLTWNGHGVDRHTIAGYAARPGWDTTTGWGSPRVDVLAPALAGAP